MKSLALRPSELCILALTVLPAFVGICPIAHADIYTWDGGGTTNNWSDAVNWVGDIAPVSSTDTKVNFTGTARLTPVQNSDITINSLSFLSGAGSFTQTGTGTITFQTSQTNFLLPNIFQSSANNQRINNPLYFNSANNNSLIYTLGAGTLTLGGVLTGSVTSSTTIQLNKQGAGTLILTAANTYPGATQVSAGTLLLDFSVAGAPASNILASGSLIATNGSTFSVMGANNATSTQTFGGYFVQTGGNTVTATSGSNGTMNLALGGITRSVGGTANFITPASGAITTSTGNVNGILGGYAVFGGNDWASASGGQIARYTAYTNDAWAAGNNTTVTASSSPASGSTTNSLRFAAPADAAITLSGTNTLSSGGILVASTAGSNLTIQGGTLVGAAAQDLVVYQNKAAGNLTISSVIADNGGATALTKSGPGQLTLMATNTYTGATRVNEGTLTFAAGSSWVASGGGTGLAVRGGGTLSIAGTVSTVSRDLQLSPTASSVATVNLTGNLTTQFSYVGMLGTGVFNQNGGTHMTRGVYLGLNSTGGSAPISNGTYNLNAGMLSASDLISVGSGGPGFFNQTNGSVSTNTLNVSNGGIYSLSGGNVNPQGMIVGSSISMPGTTFGVGTFTQTNGMVTSAPAGNGGSGFLWVGRYSDGVYNLSGGTLSTTESDVGYADDSSGYTASGTFNHTGGTHIVVNGGTVNVGLSATSTGVYTLGGTGLVQAGKVQGGAGVSTFNFNGGTLEATANNSTFVTNLGTANVQTGGAKINSGVYNVTINQTLLHDTTLNAPAIDGGLTKSGTGTLALTAANTFTGPTVVNGGALALNAGASKALGNTASVTVNAGGTLLTSVANQINNSAPMTLNAASGPSSGATVAFNTNGTSQTLGALTLSSTSVIDLASGASILKFANSSANPWTGTLAIWDWTGNPVNGGGTDRLFFGSNPTGLTVAQLAEIQFYSDAGVTSLGAGTFAMSLDGEVVPIVIVVPEATTWLGGVATTLLLLGAVRRHRQRRA